MGKPFETRMSKHLAYEAKMIDAGINDLPVSRVDKVNNLLKFLPVKVSTKLVPYTTKLINR